MAQGTAQKIRAHISDGMTGKQSKLRSFRHRSVAVSIVSTAKNQGIDVSILVFTCKVEPLSVEDQLDLITEAIQVT